MSWHDEAAFLLATKPQILYYLSVLTTKRRLNMKKIGDDLGQTHPNVFRASVWSLSVPFENRIAGMNSI